MSEEKKNSERECRNLSQEKLEQVTGGEAKRIKPRCPFCGSEKYYSYRVRAGERVIICYTCPDCNHTEQKEK